MLRLVAVAFVFGALACPSAEAAGWTKKQVAGFEMSLIDRHVIEDYNFAPQGFVCVTFGTRGGDVTGPLWHWRVRKGLLEITEEQTLQEQFQLVSMAGDIVTVRRKGGALARFRVLRVLRQPIHLTPMKSVNEGVGFEEGYSHKNGLD